MEDRMALSVTATHNDKGTWVHAYERKSGVEVKLNRLTDEPIMSPDETRCFARALYRLAARVEKRLVEIENATDAEAPPIPESRDEERSRSEATPPADLGTNGVHLLKAAG